MEMGHYEKDGVLIITVEGRLDAGHSEILKKYFSDLVESYGKFVFDLAKMEYLDSTGLGAIVFCLKSCSENNKILKIANLTERPRLIFEITRAYKIFDVYDNLDSAVAACQ